MAARPVGRTVLYGIVGSLVGAVAMGVVMTNAEFMDRVAALAASTDTTVGWVVHLAFAILFGMILGLLVASVPMHPVLTGVGWGAVLWLVGFMVLFPLALGASGDVLAFDTSTAWYGLGGHVIYGLIAGGITYAFVQREEETGQVAPG